MVVPVNHDGAGEPRSYGLFGGYPSWTADGQLLFGDAVSGIMRMDPKTGERRLFASAPGLLAIKAEEMAGGEALIALRHAGQNPARMQLGRTRGGQVVLFGVNTPGDEAVLARDAGGHGYYIGEATEIGPRLMWRSFDGDEQHELPGLPFPHGGVAADRGGRRMVLSTCGQSFRVGRIEGGRFSPLFDGRDWNDTNMTAVADGSYLFATDRSGPSEIWGGQAGRPPRRIIDEASSSPAVSAAGTLLAWVALTPGRRGIHLSRLPDGSPIRQLTSDDSDDRPAFSKDGSTLYFTRGAVDGARIYRVAVAGGKPEAVTDGGVVAFDVSIRDRLAFVVQDANGRHVMVGAAGGPFARVRVLPDGNYSELALSPDGRTLWVARGASEIIELAADGHTEPRVVWQTTNDLVSFIAADAHGLLADVATYDGDIYLVEGRFR
jgi:sugar lactone lactonase YvrE